jgi:predicted dehydrogenase
VFFDAATTQMRPALLKRAIAAGKHVYCEKPIAVSLAEGARYRPHRRARRHQARGGPGQAVPAGVLKLRMLREAGFFGRMLSVRGEFGYWVFEGDLQPAQRPVVELSRRGWRRDHPRHDVSLAYVLDNVVRQREECLLHRRHAYPEALGRERQRIPGAPPTTPPMQCSSSTAGITATLNSSWCVRVRRDDLVTFQVDGTHGSAVAGLTDCVTQSRVNTPKPVWNPDVRQTLDFYDSWQPVPDTDDVRQRIQGAVGIVHPSCRRGCTVQMDAARGREGRAARRVRTAELEGAALGGRADVACLSHARLRPRYCEETAMNAPETLPKRIKLPLPTAGSKPMHRARRARSRARQRGHSRGLRIRPRMSSSIPAARPIPGSRQTIDWDATIAYRRHLVVAGLGVAEAMDTAQRGMGLDWPTSLELIRHSLAAARDVPGALIASGAGTDHLSVDDAKSVDDVIRAYEQQIEAIEALGGRIILMASRALARVARSPADYERVYDRVLSQVRETGRHPLAWRDVRPGARRLLG